MTAHRSRALPDQAHAALLAEHRSFSCRARTALNLAFISLSLSLSSERPFYSDTLCALFMWGKPAVGTP